MLYYQPMHYYLPKTSMKKWSEEVLGDRLRAQGFSYKNNIWYRVVNREIIQFFGLRKYSGGDCEITFSFQPLFVPLDLAALEHTKNHAPGGSWAFHGSVYYLLVKYGKLRKRDDLPRIVGTKEDSPEAIIKHMQIVYDEMLMPIFDRTISIETLYREYFDLRTVAQLGLIGLREQRKVFVDDQLYIYTGLYLGHFADMLQLIYDYRACERSYQVAHTVYMCEEAKAEDIHRYETAYADIVDAIISKNYGYIERIFREEYRRSIIALKEKKMIPLDTPECMPH